MKHAASLGEEVGIVPLVPGRLHVVEAEHWLGTRRCHARDAASVDDQVHLVVVERDADEVRLLRLGEERGDRLGKGGKADSVLALPRIGERCEMKAYKPTHRPRGRLFALIGIHRHQDLHHVIAHVGQDVEHSRHPIHRRAAKLTSVVGHLECVHRHTGDRTVKAEDVVCANGKRVAALAMNLESHHRDSGR